MGGNFNMTIVDIIILIIVILILGSIIFFKSILPRIQHKPTGECSSCPMGNQKKLRRAIKSYKKRKNLKDKK